MVKQCASCGRDYEAQRSNSRFCGDTCRQRAKRSGVTNDVPEADSSESVLVSITRDTLAEVGVLETVAGAQAVLLARRMESGRETGSAVAALSKQLQALIDSAMGSVKRSDAMDEVTRRRDEKLRRARGA